MATASASTTASRHCVPRHPPTVRQSGKEMFLSATCDPPGPLLDGGPQMVPLSEAVTHGATAVVGDDGGVPVAAAVLTFAGVRRGWRRPAGRPRRLPPRRRRPPWSRCVPSQSPTGGSSRTRLASRRDTVVAQSTSIATNGSKGQPCDCHGNRPSAGRAIARSAVRERKPMTGETEASASARRPSTKYKAHPRATQSGAGGIRE